MSKGRKYERPYYFGLFFQKKPSSNIYHLGVLDLFSKPYITGVYQVDSIREVDILKQFFLRIQERGWLIFQDSYA